MNADHDFLQKMLGEQCYNASEPFIPDSYRIGLSGACRIEKEATACENRLLKVNWVTLFEADVIAANATGNQAAILDQCIEGLHEEGVDHAFTSRLAAAIFALLIISIFLNVGALAVAAWTGSGFIKPVFIIELVDEMILVTCIGIFIGIINHEVGRYIPDTLRLRDVDDKQILGVGFWMLVAMFATRAVSHPLLFITTLVVALIVVIVPILLLLACCCGGDRREEVVIDIRHRINGMYGAEEWEK
ncbi:hypothetical protein SAPIO_CDS1255 [Scedosporium apiospermum]|uniref:Uncharacterized protein n=1 Tax=Pseudallescheria apiosperma TaxID=563466 RepID=A0A084GEX3_PSEDA|nr:uncharacterized protein SAPIO_CDS1255 [Scedosporium apiospermum]KEZ45885.1 hypothetical protein SAPIO_CDS1255 [Scedosporium apiospermum]